MTESTTTDDAAETPSDDEQPSGPGFPRWLKWGLLGALAVLVVGYGAIFLYAKVLNDSPDELDESDRDAALATDGPATDGPATAPPADDAAAAGVSEWVTTDASELGYRVKENLFGVDAESVGRTNEIEGTIAVEGTQVTSGEFVVDVATITSDEGRRDRQFRGRIMSTDEFPEATFVLTEPIDIGSEPVDGTEVVTNATGELTLRGVTNPVTFEVDARLADGRIGVLGNIPVVFADYDIPNPSFGGISTDDKGLLEFVLVFEPS